MEELKPFSERTLWDATDDSEMKSNTDACFVVRMRWVPCNKGDEKEPDVQVSSHCCFTITWMASA